MRIGIDMLGTQSAGRTRGTGRYTRGLVSQLLLDARHDFVLYHYDDLPRTEFRYPDHVTARGIAADADGGLHTAGGLLARTDPDGLDILLCTCPLENFRGYLPPFPCRRGPKLAAIVYDLIPLRYPSHYLRHPGIARSYRRALAAVRQYDTLLTISESGRRDVIELLTVPPARVTNIGTGGDNGFFHPPASRAPASETTGWLAEQGIAQPFVYGLTALDYRKNLSGLLAAFERLPARLLDSHQLVVTCAASGEDDARRARSLIGNSAVAHRIVVTGPLDDDGLRRLYQYAAAFIFPSRYEGFGLPLLEAMQCGAPLVAGDNSSQIEVVGNAGLLASVDDPYDLAARLAEILDHPQLADDLRSRAVEQARRFSWPRVAKRCLDAFDQAIDAPRGSHWLKVWAARGRLAMARQMDRCALQVQRTSP